MSDPRRPVVEAVDTQRAREVLDAWLDTYAQTVGHPLPNARALLELRGRIAAALTDARLAGRAEGQPPTPPPCDAMHPAFVHDVVPTRCALPQGHGTAHRGQEHWTGYAPEWIEHEHA